MSCKPPCLLLSPNIRNCIKLGNIKILKLHSSILYLIMHNIQLFVVVVCGSALDGSIIISHFPRYFGSATKSGAQPSQLQGWGGWNNKGQTQKCCDPSVAQLLTQNHAM